MKLKELKLINPFHIELHQSGHGEFPDSYKITNEGVKAILDAVSGDDKLIQHIRKETGMNKTDEFVTKKVCENKIDGVCPLHNLFCKYPDCEE
jgi:hypothetical protein